MFRLLRYMKGYRKLAVLAPLFKMCEAAMELLVPLVVAAMIDRGIGGNDRGLLVRYALVMVLFGFLGLAFAVIAQYFSAKTAVSFTARVRHALFSHIESLSFAELDSLGTATLITRMTSDLNQVQNGVNLTLRLLLRSPFIVFGAMLMAFTVDVNAALTFAVVIPLLFLVVFAVLLVSLPLYTKVQQQLDRLLTSAREQLTGVRVIRAFTMEERKNREFDERNRALVRIQKFSGRVSALLNPLTYVILNIGILILIYRGALRVEAGLLTTGAVVALYNYMSQILVEIVKMANLIITVAKAIACGNRVEAVFEITSSLPEAPHSSEDDILSPEELSRTPAVEFCHVSYRYNNTTEDMLHNIDLAVRRGETIGVIGGTGSGKSTLLSLIPRFYDATDGALFLDGRDVRTYSLKELRQKCGMVFQKSVLFAGTIRSNLTVRKKDASDEELWEALRISCAEEFVRKNPDGLDAPVEAGGVNFSGGQRQRLAIARALVGKPPILLFDDASSALDYRTDAELFRNLRELTYRPTVFLVSQRVNSLKNAERILVLEDGEAVGLGTHSELLRTSESYREICISQNAAEVGA